MGAFGCSGVWRQFLLVLEVLLHDRFSFPAMGRSSWLAESGAGFLGVCLPLATPLCGDGRAGGWSEPWRAAGGETAELGTGFDGISCTGTGASPPGRWVFLAEEKMIASW